MTKNINHEKKQKNHRLLLIISEFINLLRPKIKSIKVNKMETRSTSLHRDKGTTLKISFQFWLDKGKIKKWKRKKNRN